MEGDAGSKDISGPVAEPEAESRGESLPQMIKAEANLLRLPLFALHTKGLRTLDGIECRGKVQRDGVVHEFRYRASRNTATPYPGPLARSAHLAFLSLMTERGFPLQNPITWSWRDLCRRMRISCSGRTVERLKGAIRSTKGLMISSQYALFSKESGTLIRTQERDLSFYDEVRFASEALPGGGVAETNQLWISHWYLANLNAFFTAPLNYDLWRYLDERSAIASRLYEFLLLNFYGGAPVLRINYENLVQFLPIKSESYLSDAKRQLEPALLLLATADVIESAAWSESKVGLAQLHFHRGRQLAQARDRDREREREPLALPLIEDESSATFQVEEYRSKKPPEWLLVADFYRLWAGQENYRPTKKELIQARELINLHGQTRVRSLIQLAIKRMKKKWPDAKTFGSLTRYLGEVADEYDREQRRIERESQEQTRRRREREEDRALRLERERFEAAWRPAWEGLPGPEREALRRDVVAANPFLARAPRMVEAFCLEELARRRAGDGALRDAPRRETLGNVPPHEGEIEGGPR